MITPYLTMAGVLAQNIRGFGQTADSTLQILNGLSFTLQRVDQLNLGARWNLYSMFPQKDRFGAYTHDVMTGNRST